MRYKLNLQVGAYHKPPDNPNADFMKLLGNPETIGAEAMADIDFNFKLKEIHRMADGTPYLIEFEAITDVDPSVQPPEAA